MQIQAAPPLLPLITARQMILVVAPEWESTVGRLTRFERCDESAAWSATGESLVVSLGRSGLAWGRGLHSISGAELRTKREGDGCAPAGAFVLPAIFGVEDNESAFARSLKLPYWQTTPALKCIDDPKSRYYNRFVDVRHVDDADWSSHEEMHRDDDCYTHGVFVAHNVDHPVAGAGSCIFIHVWRAAGQPTEGCTATSSEQLREICQWLDASAVPLLVQLPESEYVRLRQQWHLP